MFQDIKTSTPPAKLFSLAISLCLSESPPPPQPTPSAHAPRLSLELIFLYPPPPPTLSLSRSQALFLPSLPYLHPLSSPHSHFTPSSLSHSLVTQLDRSLLTWRFLSFVYISRQTPSAHCVDSLSKRLESQIRAGRNKRSGSKYHLLAREQS